MKNFPDGFSFLTPDFSFCCGPVPSKPVSLISTTAIVLDRQGHPHFTQEIKSKRIRQESTFVPILEKSLPRSPVIVVEIPGDSEK
jgi:hypothetical protein